MNFAQKLDNYIESKNLYRNEGEQGVHNLEQVLTAIGYGANGFHHGDVISVFLADNPGAIEALIEWIGKAGVSEWEENLQEANDSTDADEEETD